MRAELTKRLDVKRSSIRARGTSSEYRFRIFWIDGRRTRAAAKAPQRKRPCRPERPPVDLPSLADQSGGIVMNTALARRLALGDRVIWMGKDDCQPSGPRHDYSHHCSSG